MSERQLKDLLGEIVDDVRADGHRVDAAWDDARRRRRRATTLSAAGAVAVLCIGTGVAVATRSGNGAPDPSEPTGPATSSPSGPATDEPSSRPADGTYRKAQVWWAPEPDTEASLPLVDSALPREIDLSPGLPDVRPLQSARAVFTLHAARGYGPERLVVLTDDGTTWELPVDQIEANRDEFGNTAALTPPNGGLSPDGRHVFFAQRSSIELYDFATAQWRTIDTPDWLAEGARWLDGDTIWVPNGQVLSGVGTTYDVSGQQLDPAYPRMFSDLDLAPADEAYGTQAFGANGDVAGSYFLAGPVSGGPYTNPEAVVARTDGRTSVLALSIEGRYKMCCPSVGWIADDLVAFESQGRVLAWRPGSADLYLVSETVGVPAGEVPVASWAWSALR